VPSPSQAFPAPSPCAAASSLVPPAAHSGADLLAFLHPNSPPFYLKILNLQLDPTNVICYLGKDSASEHRVHKIIKHRCTMNNSRLDVSCMSACGNHLLAFVEAKKEASNLSTQISASDIQQLAGYMFSALAYSQWGKGIKSGDEPISALLINPTKIFRMSIWKSKTFTFGFHHRIEVTEDPLMMGWLIESFMRKYKADFERVKNLELDFDVDPLAWTCINFNLGTQLRESSATNLGFLFRSNSEKLGRLIKQSADTKITWAEGVEDLAKFPHTEELIVKYLSALLVAPPSEYFASINQLTMHVKASNRLAIKIPYLALLKIYKKHLLIVMRDMGPSLAHVMHQKAFQEAWKTQAMRQNFYKDVAQSALNLVADLGLSHNDIRPPNIAVKDCSFCLIDFDLARANVPHGGTARVLNRYELKSADSAQMMYTTAQIALVVFELEMRPTSSELSTVTKYWLGRSNESQRNFLKFGKWLHLKGPLVRDIFSEFVLPQEDFLPRVDYFNKALQAILGLQS
jgi:hypothetical protein